mmetsp:Transcript_6291/g.12437  ORF Transcript_6291/g.12437 Transcript_6291/m.12437 type:complete len:589 (+) Transcript_6291:533-2299(+)
MGSVAAEVARNLEVLSAQLVPRHHELALALVLLQLLIREVADGARHLLHRLAQPLPQNLVVGGSGAGDKVALLRGDGELAHVELLQHVLPQRLQVPQHLRVRTDHRHAPDRDAEGDAAFVACVAPLLDQHLHAADLLLHARVQRLLRRLRHRGEVDRGSLLVGGEEEAEVEVEELAEHGRQRRHRSRQLQQHLGEDEDSITGILGAAGALEPLPVHLHVPVGEVLHEAEEAGDDSVEAIGAHLRLHKLQQPCCCRLDPLVHGVIRGHKGHGRKQLAPRPLLVLPHHLHQEPVGVVPGEEDVADDVAYALLPEPQLLCSHHRGVDEVHAEGVGAMGIDDDLRVRVVLQPLAHFLAVAGKDEAVDDDVVEGRLVEQRRPDHHQRVEPAPRLIKALSDEVGGEGSLELLLVLERVVALSVGHGAGLEPAVEHLLHSLQVPPPLLRRDRDVVDGVLVQVRDRHPRELSELSDAAHAHDLLPVVAPPDGEGGAPEAVAGDGPVACVLEPVVKPLLLHKRRHPVGVVVVGHEPVADLLHLDEPRRHSLVDEGRVGAPAEGIRMLHCSALHQPAGGLECGEDRLVRLLHVQPLEV